MVARATRAATVEPDEHTMQGATWVIEDVQASSIYRVRTALNRVTTILLPPGERFNGAVGGDVEHFLINVAYAGPRPAVSILPRSREAKGNLQLVTTGEPDLEIPGRPFTFGQLIQAQAAGDASVLADHGRPVLTLTVVDVPAALAALRSAL